MKATDSNYIDRLLDSMKVTIDEHDNYWSCKDQDARLRDMIELLECDIETIKTLLTL